MKGSDSVVVWDPFVRIFHWSLVLLFFVAYATGSDDCRTHRYVGSVIMIMVLLRILWGFIGSTHARFSNFAYSPRAALSYLQGLITGKSKHYIGHNPAASWMIYCFFMLTLVVGISGYAIVSAKQHQQRSATEPVFSLVTNAYADSESHGHGRGRHGKSVISGERFRDGFDAEDEAHERDTIWEDIHEAAAQTMLFLVGLHVVGVIASSLRHRENLILSMVNGKKRSLDAA